MTTLYTIGYERATIGGVIAALKDAGVELLVDVRDVPMSRRAGFSKRVLAASLAETGVDYLHLKGLGTPKPGRDAAKRKDKTLFHAIYAEKLETPEARADLETLAEVAVRRPACLLCFERAPSDCHRNVIATLIADRGAEIAHLFADPLG